ncbi:unnamed protein product [Caenorhabditis nigoni]
MTTQLCEEHSKLDNYKRLIKIDTFAAIRQFPDLVKQCSDHNCSPDSVDAAARLLLDHIHGLSIYKKRWMAKEISKLDTLSKLLICCQIKGRTGIPLEACMANHEEFMVFTRPKLDYLTAMGNNAFGKLGVGSDALIIEEPTRVQIGGHVENVFIGSRHTIFWMANGDIYGCGWTANFSFGPQTKESISIPIKLNYITAEKPDFIRIVVTDNSTEFFDYLPDRKLVVGQLKAGDVAVTTGSNWSIVNEKLYRYQRKAPVDLKIPDSNGAEKNVKINIGLTPRFKPFLAEGDSRPWRYAVVFADGYRVDTTITPCEYTVCRDGTVYAMISGTFYRGYLKFGPGSTTEKCADVLVVVLEEFILPQTVERFAVDSDGNSFIFYLFKSGTILDTFWPGGQVFEVMKKTRHEPMEAQKLVMNFQKIFDELENEFPTWKTTIYDSTGLPTKAIKVLCGLLTLQHFIRVKEDTNTPDVLGRGLVGLGPEDTNKFMERLDYEMEQSILHSTEFPVFTVKPGSGHRVRKQIIEDQSVKYVTDVMSNIRELLGNLTEIKVEASKEELLGCRRQYLARPPTSLAQVSEHIILCIS